LTVGGVNAKTIKLTPLGSKLVAPEKEGDDLAARREAIMRPRISKEFFERYRRAKFPNDVIAGNVLKSLGIPAERVKSALEIVKANGRYAGIIRDMRLDEIGQEEVQTFVGKLARGRSRHTILNDLGTLASVLKMARKWGYAVAGFRQGDLVIPCSKPSKAGRFFTAEQVRSILALASEPWQTIFALAAMTGLRPGEVLGLSIDDLDFEQRLIFVRRSA
jgi:integrase